MWIKNFPGWVKGKILKISPTGPQEIFFFFRNPPDNYRVYPIILSNDKLKKELLRNSLKNLEVDFKGTSIIRCHRSHMVNLENLNLVKKTGQKMLIKLNHVPDLIPVSKTYQEAFKAFLQMDQQNRADCIDKQKNHSPHRVLFYTFIFIYLFNRISFALKCK